ncbi:transposase [Epilithonimonas sp. UC225_85]|uniref:transposase n=1 Tax=Epilithonimonas sp. UC225_85 TaxID=3350167 RepID=UPI0036D27300
MNIKDFHIGSLIRQGVTEREIKESRICNFLKCSEQEIQQMYEAKSLDTEILLRWSKLLEYDFFRIYSQHLILYSPQGNTNYNDAQDKKLVSLPQFRKNIYTKEVIDFILERIKEGKMTKTEVINNYKIPKTTLNKWLKKYTENWNK